MEIKYWKAPIIRVLEILALFTPSKKTGKLQARKQEMGSELHLSENLTFGAKITSTRIACLDDSVKISRSELDL